MTMERSVVNASGNVVVSNKPIDLEGKGDITVGTSEVEITATEVSETFRIQADDGNSGIIYLGKTGVLSNGTNDFVRLAAGDEVTFDYNDIVNPIYAISDTAGQTINVGVLVTL